MKNIKILLAEDDESLGALLKEYLNARAYHTDWAVNGQEAKKLLKLNLYDLCILDVMMPVKDGFTLAQELRDGGNQIPIIFLTAKSLKDDIKEGFSLGADDYITKPFDMEELLFRIDAVLRRTVKGNRENGPSSFLLGRFSFDAQKQTLTDGADTTKLTTKESELLRLLCENTNEVLERNFALKTIWADDNYFNARSMDVYITKLRKYLASEPGIQILNIHGRGFKLLAEQAQ